MKRVLERSSNDQNARARSTAPGRRRAIVRRTTPGLLVLLGLAAPGCAPVGAPEPTEPAGPPPLVLEAGQPTDADEARARTLLAEARAALAVQQSAAALQAARTVVEELPATRVSGEALDLLVQAAVATGEWGLAEASARRMAGLLTPDDPRAVELLEVQARALAELGQPTEALDRLIEAGSGGPLSAEAGSRARAIAGQMGAGALAGRVESMPAGHPLAAPLRVELALALRLSGEQERAREVADEALRLGARGEDAEVAGAIAEGRLPAGVEPVRIAAVLPLSGSPALRAFAEGVREGIEAAITAQGLEGVVELDVLDSGGDLSTTEMLVRSAEESGVAAIVGPLQADELLVAARARQDGVALVSPTAFALPEGASGDVYSLGAADPGAPALLADWAIGVGIRDVAVLHPAAGPAAEEARLFQARFQERGGRVLTTLSYQPGATFFQEQIRTVRQLRPEALYVPAPPEDLQALAPQVSFFGLDTLGVQVLGSAAWADPQIAATVGRRHLDGVVAVTPRLPTESGAGRRAFVEAYERRFRRSLVDPTAPSLGYDAASLVLRAVRTGARSAGAVRRALAEVDGFDGATGVLSIDDGRIGREYGIVCLWNGGVLPLASNQRPEPQYRAYMPDPETGLIPEGPGRRAGFVCPGAEPPAQEGMS